VGYTDAVGEGKFRAVTQFDPRKDKQMPATRAGGLYKTFYQQGGVVLVEANPYHAIRDGSGTFQNASPPNSECAEFMLPGVPEGRQDAARRACPE
jgi:hypothetical protein